MISSTAQPIHGWTRWAIAPVFLIGACLTSNFVWDLHDQKVWDWDPSFYAFSTLLLWDTTSLGLWNWLNAMAHVLTGTPPLMVWLGQFFIPLRHLTGDVDPALLSVNILTAGVTLVLVYRTARKFNADMVAATVAVLACASSPAFVGLTGRYMTEMTQCMSSAVLMYVAYGIERRSVVRSISLALIGVALSFLSKSSSMTFVLPFVTYMLVACWLGRKPRARTGPIDLAWMLVAALAAAATLIWYVIHWSGVVQHFIEATTDANALNWGEPVIFSVKLAFWTGLLNLAVSPLPGVSAVIVILVVIALLVGVFWSRGETIMATLERSVENGTLFALAVAGIVVLTILAFSLQINEDTRFLLPLIPLIATLLAWSLSVLQNRTISGLALIVFSVNLVVSHAYAHDFDPARLSVFNYLQKVSRNTDDKALLTRMVNSTCQASLGDRTNLIIVNYPTLNGNNALFYSLKEGLEKGYHCSYLNIVSLETDVQVALKRIEALNPPYIISAVPDRQNAPNNFNRIARSATEHLQHDRRFELAPGSGDYLLIFRKAMLEAYCCGVR